MMKRSMSLIGAAFLVGPAASAAAADVGKCRAIADPTERLACYDRAADQPAARAEPVVPAEPAPARNAPATPLAASPQPPTPAPVRAPTREEAQAATSGRIAAAEPLRHGYFRLAMEDGAVYETTVVGPPPPVGAEVHIRRTLFGTTFFDIRGWSPITVRLSRQ